MIIREMPIHERPREKMITKGRETLSNGELLAILLRTGTKENNSLRIADEILSLDKRGLNFLRDCTIEELSSIKGVGLAKASQIIAAVELGRRISIAPAGKKNFLTNTQAVLDMCMETMRYYKKEYFNVLLVDAKGNLIAEENVAIGDCTSSIVHPRETFRSAIKRSAFAMILVHNHPSGDPTPSPDDIGVTKRLCEAGEILGIKVADHVIIGDGVFTSLGENGFREVRPAKIKNKDKDSTKKQRKK